MSAQKTPFRLSSAKGRWIIVATAVGSGMVFLDGSVVNVALPRIQTDLHVPLSGLQWIIDSYALFLAALLLVGGAIGDAYGRKLAFQVGLIIFILSSIACGLAPNAGVLIAARAVQGLGGAFLVPGSLAMIKATIASEDSGRAIGVWAGLSGATTAFGPVIGGYFVSSVSWRLIFFINVPLALLTFYATTVHVPETKDIRASKHLDYAGAALTVVGLGGLTYGLIQGPSDGWLTGTVLGSIVAGIVALIIFPFVEHWEKNPMVPLELFRSSNFTGSNLATLGVYFSFSGAFLFLVLKLQQVQSYSPAEAGAALIPVTLILVVLSPRVGGLIGRFGARALMGSGAFIISIAFFLLAMLGRSAPYWTELLPSLIVLALGMSLFVTPLTTTVMGSVPSDSVGVASGVNNAVSRVAGLLAVASLGVIVVAGFQNFLTSRLDALGITGSVRSSLINHAVQLAHDPIPKGLSAARHQLLHVAIQNAYVNGYRWAMLTCTALCLLSALVSVVMIRPEPVTPIQEPAPSVRNVSTPALGQVS